MTATFAVAPDYIFGSNVDAGTVQAFTVNGGLYAFVISGTWGGGNADLQVLGPDGSTYITVLSAVVTANKAQVIDLPAGQYKVVITTSTAVYYSVARTRRAAQG